MAEIARHLSIKGRVQGVFFRAWARDQADRLGVKGGSATALMDTSKRMSKAILRPWSR